MADAGIKINGRHYPIPQSLRIGETRMIKRMTGLNPPDFMQALGELNRTQDPDVGAALVWWVVHREDPSFGVEQIDKLEWGQIEGEDDDEAVASLDPKDGGVMSASSPRSVDASPSSLAGPGAMIPANGGGPVLVPSDRPTWPS
jgi:hypothetical protein